LIELVAASDRSGTFETAPPLSGALLRGLDGCVALGLDVECCRYLIIGEAADTMACCGEVHTVHLDYRFVLFSNHAFFFGLGYGILSAGDSGIFFSFWAFRFCGGIMRWLLGRTIRCGV